MSTHATKVTVTFDVSMHVSHGLVGVNERAAIKAAKADLVAWIGRRTIGVSSGGGNAGASWSVKGASQTESPGS